MRETLKEQAFEAVIESHLLANGYSMVDRDGFDRERAIFPEIVLAFIRETQPDEWKKLEALHGERTGEPNDRRFAPRFINEMQPKGSFYHGSIVSILSE